MASAQIPTYSSIKKASSEAADVADSVFLRDASGDGAIARRGTITRLTTGGGEYLTGISTKTTTYTAAADDRVILGDATGGAFSITLPAAASSTGQVLTIKRISASNNVTVDGNASEEIDGATTKALATNLAFITIICDGTAWHIIATGGTVS